MVADAFVLKGIHVHFDVGPNNYQQSPPLSFIVPAADAKGGNPIQEETCHDDSTVNPPRLCPFPEQPGVLAWKTNLGILKTWPKDLGACANDPVNGCTPRFQHGRKDSYHYVVFAHALGLPRWSFQDGGITSIVVAGNTATITTDDPHELFPDAHVTISGAVTQPALNRTYLVSTVQDDHSFTIQTGNVTGSVSPSSDSALFITVGELPTWSFKYRLNRIQDGKVFLTNPHALSVGDQVTIAHAAHTELNGTYEVSAVGPTTVAGTTYHTFTIPVGSADAVTDPDLSIISAQGGTVSGYADVGGADVAIALGKWLADGESDTTVAGTFMHEFGHNLGLTHGGYYFDGSSSAPTFEANCKPNYQSVMSYLFQVDLLRDRNGNPVVGYSGQHLDQLNETSLGAVSFLGSSDPGGTGFVFPEFANTSWYTSTAPAGNPTPASRRCSGTPLQSGETMYRVKGDADAISPAWANDQDINFDGSSTVSMRGYDDWDNLDLRQIGATGSEFFAAGFYAPGGGFYAPGGGFWAPGGGFYAPGGGFWAPGGGFYAPGGGFYAPGGGFYAPGGGFYEPGGGFYAPGGGFYAPGRRLLGAGRRLLCPRRRLLCARRRLLCAGRRLLCAGRRLLCAGRRVLRPRRRLVRAGRLLGAGRRLLCPRRRLLGAGRWDGAGRRPDLRDGRLGGARARVGECADSATGSYQDRLERADLRPGPDVLRVQHRRRQHWAPRLHRRQPSAGRHRHVHDVSGPRREVLRVDRPARRTPKPSRDRLYYGRQAGAVHLALAPAGPAVQQRSVCRDGGGKFRGDR